MGIDKDTPKISKFIPNKLTVSKTKQAISAPRTEEVKSKNSNTRFISEDVKNYFSYNLKTNFDRSSNSKNSVTYDLNSFDEDRS